MAEVKGKHCLLVGIGSLLFLLQATQVLLSMQYLAPGRSLEEAETAVAIEAPPDFEYESYSPASTEAFVVENAVHLGYQTRDKENAPGCPIWKDENATNPTIFNSLQQFRSDLVEYNRLLQEFNSSVRDVRGPIRAKGDYSVCDPLDLKPGGLEAIFTDSRQLSRSRAGFVEPLLPPMRHPDFCFRGRRSLFDTSYLIHDFGTMCRQLKPHSRIVLFDLGASLNFGGRKSPMVPLMDKFHKLGFPFDHIYAYEVSPTDPSKVVKNVPLHFLPAYHWINVGVETSPGSPFNPFTILLEQYNKDDLIIFKLDIDTPHLELPLAHQLLGDERLLELVDHFYFEHHVHLEELSGSWSGGMNGTAKDSLDLFHGLRQKGVAAHYWV